MIEQMVSGRDLYHALDTGIDSAHQPFSHTMHEKYRECSKTFIDSLVEDGIQMPVLVSIKGVNQHRSELILGNGHHRVAVANEHNLDVPVLFVRYVEIRKNRWSNWRDQCQYKLTSSPEYPSRSGRREEEW